jgi:hypothetical protein
MQVSDLKAMDEWAARRIGSGNETPWDWYQLMKLREALEALIAAEETRARQQKEGLPAQAPPQGLRPRLAVDNDPQESVPRHR